MSTITKKFKIEKTDDDQRLVFGWASVAVGDDGAPVVDHDGDIIPVQELEKAAYDFVLHSGQASDAHERAGIGQLVESMVITDEKRDRMGFGKGRSGWWVGFKVHDDKVWKLVKSGDYSEFSIEGEAQSETIDA